MTNQAKSYDLAVSFSGAQRAYVESVVRECKKLGLKVFYDLDEQVNLWGLNVIVELRKIYGSVSTRYVVPFFSRDYFAGSYPMDELRTSLLRAIEQEDYILPVLMDDFKIPAEYMSPATIYLESAAYSPERLAQAILQRIGIESRQATPKSSISSSGTSSTPRLTSLRMPTLPPAQLNAEETLDETLQYIGRRFADEINVLENYGFRGYVRTSSSQVSVLVDKAHSPWCELKLTRGDAGWAGSLTMAFQWPRVTGGSNGFVRPEWDPGAGVTKLNFQDLSNSGAILLLTAEELFEALWSKIIIFLDQTGR
ncbi:TIR domain-containing protein [Umezawaea sp. NPDC059074]|uniref:TIR domain-containing protein n=1 Tax=Umezawaea sp. NPDC059074 TaxID=3346716 RepID=UPI003691F0C0